MKITKRQLQKIVKEAVNLREQWDDDPYSEYEWEYADEIAEHGPIVNVYYPGGNISQTVIEFEDGHEVSQGDPDEPWRFL